MPISVNAEEAKADVKLQVTKWMEKCVKKGGKGHDTSHAQTNVLGIGYPGASESDPAQILDTEWAIVKKWWESEMMVDTNYTKWVTASMTGGGGVWDLCCKCADCDKVSKRDFGSSTGYTARERTLVYHLKVLKTLV